MTSANNGTRRRRAPKRRDSARDARATYLRPKLKRWMKEHASNPGDVADGIGISEPTLRKMLAGHVPNLGTLDAIAYFLAERERDAKLVITMREAKKHEQAVLAEPTWEDVGPCLQRFEVPGGWIYRDNAGGRGTLVYVPTPKGE